MSDESEPANSPIVRSAQEERDYLLRRAEDHRQLAARTTEKGARTTHMRFERLYARRAEQVAVLPD